MSFPLFLLLLTILSLDAFAAGLSYGTEKVRVSPFSLLLLALVSAGVLTLSLAAGDRFLGLFPLPSQSSSLLQCCSFLPFTNFMMPEKPSALQAALPTGSIRPGGRFSQPEKPFF